MWELCLGYQDYTLVQYPQISLLLTLLLTSITSTDAGIKDHALLPANNARLAGYQLPPAVPSAGPCVSGARWSVPVYTWFPSAQ